MERPSRKRVIEFENEVCMSAVRHQGTGELSAVDLSVFDGLSETVRMVQSAECFMMPSL
ncbi:MAG: hypothetical protein ACPGQS_05530 [Bradymonadia bacterium]